LSEWEARAKRTLSAGNGETLGLGLRSASEAASTFWQARALELPCG